MGTNNKLTVDPFKKILGVIRLTTIYERLLFLAKGGRKSYWHKGKENKNTTKLQNLLDEFAIRSKNHTL
jgi:hypothetical protein